MSTGPREQNRCSYLLGTRPVCMLVSEAVGLRYVGRWRGLTTIETPTAGERHEMPSLNLRRCYYVTFILLPTIHL
jgi:hypothetical protein